MRPWCEWWWACRNEATHERPHPVLGAVPICDRCEEKVTRLETGAAA